MRTRTGRTAFGAVVVTLALGIPTVAAAQGGAISDLLLDEGTSGVRESAKLLDDYLLGSSTPAGRGTRQHRWAVLPTAVEAEGLSMWGGTVGFINRGRLMKTPFQVRAGYRRLDIVGTEWERMLVNAKVPVSAFSDARTAVSVNGDFARTTDVGDRYSLALAGERQVRPNLALGGSASYATFSPDADGADDTSGLIGAVGASWKIADRTTFSFDYQLKNELTDEDSGSFTIVQRLPTMRSGMTSALVLGAAKHRVVYATLALVF